MKNQFIINFKSKVKLNIQGKHIERFIKRLATNGIELLKIEHIKRNEINILIYKEQYEKLMELKTVYDVTILDSYGIIKVRKVIDINKFLIGFSILGIVFLIILSNIIFTIDIIHTDIEVRTLLEEELKNHGIGRLRFRKSYEDLQNIKANIIDKYNDSIEWIEIERLGTKYIVRLEERIKPDIKEELEFRHIISSRDAIIKKIVANSGEIIRNIDEYVVKGTVVISGHINLYDAVKDTVRAEGVIYGEVWYQTTVEYPFVYNEVIETGNTRTRLGLRLLNWNFELGRRYKEKIVNDNIILSHVFLPFSLVRQNQKEVVTISEVYTFEQVIDKAIEKAITTIELNLKDDEHIIDYKVMKTNLKSDRVILDVFFSIYENITDYEVIERVEE